MRSGNILFCIYSYTPTVNVMFRAIDAVTEKSNSRNPLKAVRKNLQKTHITSKEFIKKIYTDVFVRID